MTNEYKSVSNAKATESNNTANYLQKSKSGVTVTGLFPALKCLVSFWACVFPFM